MQQTRPPASVDDRVTSPIGHHTASPARLAAGLFLVGAVLLIIGNSIHPIDASPSSTSRLELADTTSWIWIHLVIAFGFIAITAGFVTAQRVFADPRGAALARLAATTALIGGTVLVVVFAALDGYAMSVLARDWASVGEAERESIRSAAIALDAADTGMSAIGSTALLGLTLGAFGLAVITSRPISAWLGWVAVGVGIAGLAAGLTMAATGPTSFTINVLFRPVALAATVFFLLLGNALRRLAKEQTEKVQADR